MIENSDDLIQFSSPQPNLTVRSVLGQKTPKSLLDSSITSDNNTLTESLHRPDDLNESKLDRVDFIEVSDLDQDDMWLCEPKPINSNKENVKSLAKNSKNAYKWMMDDFDQDKNLDKVKRTLLVALDDISKGFNRRSRSVSTTRTGYGYYNHDNQMAPPPTPSSRFLEPQTPQMVQSKSIESILNESTADVIDANYYQNGSVINSKYATIVKAKRPSVDDNLIDTSSNSPCNLTYSNDSNDLIENKTETYEDFTDLQVVAKMQEESLRQSVLNLSKISAQNLNRNGFSTATITKRVHSTRPSFSVQLPNEISTEANFRRDSASSSDHSSISSTNLESPYNSQVNVNSNGPNGKQSPIKKPVQMPKSSTITHGISTVSSKPKRIVNRSSTPSTRELSRESRLPTPRSGRSSGPLNTSLTVNVKSAQSKSPSNFGSRNLQLSKPPPAPFSNQTNQTPSNSARRPIAYGTQRSATTSIVPSQSQIKAALFQKNQVQKSAHKTKPIARTSTNQSIVTSPSNTSFVSSSSSAHQIDNALSPRGHSPSQLKVSPSGLMGNGPIGRRERSTSPANKYGSQSNLTHGSNSNLHTIAESRIPAHLNSPAMNRKMTSQIKVRKSFLPQPVQSTVANRQSSISPSRTRNVSPADWKDGCY